MSCCTTRTQKIFQNAIIAQGNPVKIYRGSTTINGTTKRATLNDESYIGQYYAILSFAGSTRDMMTNMGVNGGQMGKVIFGANVKGVVKDRDCIKDIDGREFAIVGQPTYQGSPATISVECIIEELSIKPKGVT
jgi:hypothetical protein